MGVDQSKFRTCHQTSFGRRHRHGVHRQTYQYKLLKDTVHAYSTKNECKAAEKDDNAQGYGSADSTSSCEGDGVWQSQSQNLAGGYKTAKEDVRARKMEQYVAGPDPTVTGIVKNTTNENEMLRMTITCLQDGMVRLRMTEMYGTLGSPFEQPRVTFDELVLNGNSMHPAGYALLLKDVGVSEQMKKLIPSQLLNNYIAVQYGDVDRYAKVSSNLILLIQLEPFVLSLYRHDSGNNATTGPVVTLGSERMMHFEVRRLKQDSAEGNQNEYEALKEAEEEEESKEGKEIVGYWEDGLAIYADGTREEKKVVNEKNVHHHLTEEELDAEGLWDEYFNSHHDTKPFGPMSVGMDISFSHSQHLFGIPEHASSNMLKTTTSADPAKSPPHYKEPYRLYNLDVFGYILDETMALYGDVPLIVSQSVTTGTVGVFWFNPTETFVDVWKSHNTEQTATHWMSESGIIDVFLLPGPNPTSMYRQYADLTGTTPVPPMFALGYHQCRWNYKDEKDVYTVHDKFEELNFPYDALWLDIEHTDEKRYFTWDARNFPNPTDMIDKLAASGRRMVTIIDPHIKRDDDYYIHREATAKGLYIKDKDGKNDYDGWCWPGSSSYLDFTAAHVREWWAQQFAYSKYKGSTPTLFTWNDMNEPSVFNGPEISMPKDLRNLNGDEHREWHNLYGMLFHRATTEGQIQRNPPDNNVRPFVLSRSFFAGSQKYGAIWTGDNLAEWSHLAIAVPMLLSLNVAALSFVGADVGGFFGNPDAELFTRWMQAGAYQPFFRGHAHKDSKRREPWMFDGDTLNRSRKAAIDRYALLPYWYTVFHIAETTGMPVMRTMWMQYPQTEPLFAMDDQYMIGSDLLVKPITSSGVAFTNVAFPTDDNWYDAQTLEPVALAKVEKGTVESVTVPAGIDTIPVFQRGGSIVCRKMRLRQSTVLMKTDPYTIYIALDASSKASGLLYMDDEETFSYQRSKEFAAATFTATPAPDDNRSNLLVNCTVVVGKGWDNCVTKLAGDRMIEQIIIMMGGISGSSAVAPNTVVVVSGSRHGPNAAVEFDYANNMVAIRNPDVSALTHWTIAIS